MCLLSLLKPGWELVPSAAGTSKHGCPRDEALTLTTGMPAPETMAGSAQQSCGTALCTPGPPTQYSSASCKLWNPHRKTFQSRQMYGSIQLQAQALGAACQSAQHSSSLNLLQSALTTQKQSVQQSPRNMQDPSPPRSLRQPRWLAVPHNIQGAESKAHCATCQSVPASDLPSSPLVT